MRHGIFIETAREIGALVEEKNAAYGDSFAKSELILKVLFPDGVGVSQYRDLLAVTRILDKLFRIATDKDAFGEEPWRDIAGYAILSVAAATQQKEETQNERTRGSENDGRPDPEQ